MVACIAAAQAFAAEQPDVLERARVERRAGNLAAAADLLIDAVSALPPAEQPETAFSLQRELGEIRFKQGRGREAAKHFELALEHAPGRGVVHYQAGLAYRIARNESDAAAHLRQAVELGFRTTAALLHLAGAEFASGSLGAGLHASRGLLAMQPRSASVLLQIGRALFDRFFYADSLQAFDAALLIEPESYEARHFAALINHLQNRHDAAVSLLAGLREGRATAESSALLASALAQRGSTREAEALFQETIRRWPDSPHAYLNLAFLLLDLGRLEEAESRLQQLPGIAAIARPKVFFVVRKNSCASASADGRRATGLRPRVPAMASEYFRLASDLAARHHHRTAASLLRLVQAYEGDSPRMLEALSFSCLHIDPGGRSPVDLLEQLVDMEPENGRAHYLLGRAYLRLGQHEDAIESHRTAVALEPRNSQFHTELARAFANGSAERDRVSAMNAFARATELDAGNAVARYEWGKLLAGAGRVDDAIEVLEGLIATEPEFHNAYYVLGQACLRAGRRTEAERHLQQFSRMREVAAARAPTDGGFSDQY